MAIAPSIPGAGHAPQQHAAASGPRTALVRLTLVGLGIAAAYWQTLLGMAHAWTQTDTYVHGWLVVPVAAWLTWRKRTQLAVLPARASARGALALAGAVLLWVGGGLAHALVVQQLAVVAMIAAAVWAVAGPAWARALAFPLAYLLFAVPFGEVLVPALMEWTALATVALLRWSGIPVFSDGMLFSTSAGDFEVARACSGVRYLIASAALGILYAHLALRGRALRWAFAALAVVMPVLANALRAYLIVVIAHLTDLRHAAGVDHFIYGWVFFGLIMLLLFAIGERLRRGEAAAMQGTAPAAPAPVSSAPLGWGLPLGCLALIASGPLLAARLDALAAEPAAGSRGLPPAAGDWRGPLAPDDSWRLQFRGTPSISRADYEHPVLGRVGVAAVFYPRESQAAELIGHGNLLAAETDWRFVSSATVMAGGAGRVRVERFASLRQRERLTVWSVYALDGRALTHPYAVKLLGTLRRLRGEPRAPVLIAIARIHSEADEAPAAALESFAAAHLSELLACTRRGASGCTAGP